MARATIIWDLEDDPEGNYRHVMDSCVSVEEVEEVLADPANQTVISRTSGNRITFGFTSKGNYVAVVWEHVAEEPLMIYPITAYPVPKPRQTRRRKK